MDEISTQVNLLIAKDPSALTESEKAFLQARRKYIPMVARSRYPFLKEESINVPVVPKMSSDTPPDPFVKQEVASPPKEEKKRGRKKGQGRKKK